MDPLEWRTVLYKNFKSDPSYWCTVTGHRPIYVTDVKEDIRVPLAIMNQMNTGTVSKAMLVEILSAYGLFQVPGYLLELNWCKFAHINYVVLISWGNMYTTSIVLRQWAGTKVKPVELDQCHLKKKNNPEHQNIMDLLHPCLQQCHLHCKPFWNALWKQSWGITFFLHHPIDFMYILTAHQQKIVLHKQFSSMYDLEITPVSVKVVWVGKHTMLSHKANLWWHL